MRNYLITVTETYRVDTEAQVEQMLEESKQNTTYTLVKYSSTYKEKKVKGEVIDSWFKVTLTKQFNDEKEPIATVNISYEV